MRALVVIPTYNERENLPRVVSGLLQHEGVGVLVVDDGSPDGTGQVADGLAAASSGRVEVLHRTALRGLGRSYVDGLTRALASDAEFICQMDADLSHDPKDIPRLVAGAGSADMAIGSRYVPGGRIENWPVRRKILSRGANAYIRAITGVRTHDNTSGFRCWRREALRRMPLDRIVSDGYAFLVELTWEAHRAGFRIAEVPITFVERRAGASKLSGGVLLESALLPWRLALRAKRR
ncbi:MAG: polyprenol monophosphomannose synthase [Vicinamibacterales bacterium]